MKYITIKDTGKLKTSEILGKCKKLFKVWSCYNDEQLDKDFLPIKTSRKFKYVQEADENLKNKSANDLEKEGILGITLRERLLFELEYFKKEGKHLDINNATLCSGSRDSDGGVPGLDWGGDELDLSWCSPGNACGSLRSREVVSLESLPFNFEIKD